MLLTLLLSTYKNLDYFAFCWVLTATRSGFCAHHGSQVTPTATQPLQTYFYYF